MSYLPASKVERFLGNLDGAASFYSKEFSGYKFINGCRDVLNNAWSVWIVSDDSTSNVIGKVSVDYWFAERTLNKGTNEFYNWFRNEVRIVIAASKVNEESHKRMKDATLNRRKHTLKYRGGNGTWT